MEVEDKHQIAPLKHHQFIALILATHVSVGRGKEAEGLVQMAHSAVEGVEVAVFEDGGVAEVPPAAAVVEGSVISRDELAGAGVVRIDSREINPLGMAKFISHEVQVALSSQADRDHSDHLVECNATIHNDARGAMTHHRHTVVHVLVHEPKSDGLVTYKRLIVALGVGDAALGVATVGEGVDDIAHFPGHVIVLFHQLNPFVGDGHLKAVVKPNTTLGPRATECGHP
mmetsp:Transcript_3077/g.5033  ORF Transcript_3077/g.5033 Transcript_3077/m.5033 type:complete len:228 (-) Transcript_3077:1852-2535(-)